MDMILEDIEKAIAAGCYYVAVHMVLALPDICAALEAPDGRNSGGQYRAWYDRNLATIFPRLTAADCYRLRCGVVHQGRFGPPGMQYDRVIFTISNGTMTHNNILEHSLNLDVVTFCNNSIAAVKSWYASKQNDPNVRNNLPKLVQYRPNGTAPYIVGTLAIS